MRPRLYPTPMLSDLARKINLLRRSLGLKQGPFAERLGVTQATVSRWESGKSDPEYEHLVKLAEMANLPVQEFLESPDDPVVRLPGTPVVVLGSVAAGVWRQAWEWPEEDRFVFHGGLHVDVQGEGRFGLRVDGESMNLVYPAGTILDCIATYGSRDVNPGQRVVVVRRRVCGDVEATVKEYTRDSSGAEWLLPRSTHPDFQAPISVGNADPDIEEIAIIGIVVGSYRPE